MRETDYWNRFIMTGSVADYLQYKSVQQGKEIAKNLSGTKTAEEKDEDFYRWADNKGTKYR